MTASRGGISTGAVLLAGAGGVAVWAAVKGVGLGSGLRTLLSGHTLPAGEDLALTATTIPGGPLPAASDSSIVAAASRYLGTGSVYRWGGASPRGWDCSGFCNWTLNHDLGRAIPGYSPG